MLQTWHARMFKKSKMDTINRQAALWIPVTPRLLVIGSRLNPNTINELQINVDNTSRDASGAPLVIGDTHLKALIHVWKKVFGSRTLPPLDSELNDLLSSYDTNKWNWDKAKQFDIHLVVAYIAHLRHTGSGKDGIHNFCFRFGDLRSTKFLVRLFDAFTNGDSLPADINDGLFCFLSQADKDDDLALSKEGVFRDPSELRPLTLKNADNQIIAGITT